MKKVNHPPAGLNTINPYLMVENVSKLISFIETVFNGVLKYKLDRPDGSDMHAEISLGDSTIMAGEPTAGDER